VWQVLAGRAVVASVLTFGIDGRLMEGDVEIARVGGAAPPAHGCVIAGGTRGAIYRAGRAAWGFRLAGSDEHRTVVDFKPYLLRRGGRFAMGDEGALLSAHPIRQGRWTIAWSTGATIVVTHLRRRRPVSGGRIVRVIRSAGYSERLQLITEDHDLVSRAPEVIAFACWLIQEWEAVPITGGPFTGPGYTGL
jgi:hypothetical protein